MGAYIFVFASLIAVTGILFTYKINVEKMKENPDLYQQAQQKLFIGAAISEAIPIILVIYGFMTVEEVDNIFIPLMLVILIMAFSTFFIFLQTKVDVDESNRKIVQSFSMVTIALVHAIPLIAIMFLFTASS